jgi:ribose/xylose/arabinose/galactoside ABC-type transport system permease subunit
LPGAIGAISGTHLARAERDAELKSRVSKSWLTLAITAIVCLLLYSAAAVAFPKFFSASVFLDFFNDNAFLGITALGLTFVILSGGIDLSVGSLVALTSIIIAVLVQKKGYSPILAISLALACGATLGLLMGGIIELFKLPAFLVTLGGMFLARGLAFMVSLESIPLDDPFYLKVGDWRLPLGGGYGLPVAGCVFVLMSLIGAVIAHFTRFGRNVYALGGNEQSAVLMGLPVRSTRILVYVLSGFCSALAGVVYTFYTSSGNPSAATGLELDAIAAVVIGGTLLTGGVGYVAGTVLGVLIFGIIQTAIIFQGTLSSWWTKIVIGFLLLIFLLIQKLIQPRNASSH